MVIDPNRFVQDRRGKGRPVGCSSSGKAIRGGGGQQVAPSPRGGKREVG